jgi:Flp pilus assembly protein TadD
MNRQQRRAAAKSGPDAKEAEFARLYTYARKKVEDEDFREATAAFRRADRLKPNSPQIHFDLGQALLAWGRPDEALAAYRKAALFKCSGATMTRLPPSDKEWRSIPHFRGSIPIWAVR